jgi:hypothetical protein
MTEHMTRERSATTFVLTLKPTIAGIDPIRALRAVLKFALRRFGLRAVSAYEATTPANQDEKLPVAAGAGGRSKTQMRILS